MLADIILILHFLVVIFITVGFLLIPIGYYYDWSWIRNFKLRLFHFGLMFIVTFETLVGITCPLTSIENYLRGINNNKSYDEIKSHLEHNLNQQYKKNSKSWLLSYN